MTLGTTRRFSAHGAHMKAECSGLSTFSEALREGLQ
jgi:hypothetical protein